MIERAKLKSDIIKWFDVKRGIYDLVDEDDLITSGINNEDIANMVVDIEKQYSHEHSEAFELRLSENETLGTLTDCMYVHLNHTSNVPKEKQLFGVYYASREFARQHNDPILDVVAAITKKEAEDISALTINDHHGGLHAVPLSHYEQGYQNSPEGSELRMVYSSLIKQLKDMWKQKSKA